MDPAEDTIDTTPPALYLSQLPTPGEHALIMATGQDGEQAASVAGLAKVAVRLHAIAETVAPVKLAAGRFRRYMWATISSTALTLGAVGGYAYHRIEATGIAEEHAAAQARAFDEYRAVQAEKLARIEFELSQIRGVLMRLSGIDPDKPPAPYPPDSSIPFTPDKLSLLFTPQGTQCSTATVFAAPFRSL